VEGGGCAFQTLCDGVVLSLLLHRGPLSSHSPRCLQPWTHTVHRCWLRG
jgi:hypothetical protein